MSLRPVSTSVRRACTLLALVCAAAAPLAAQRGRTPPARSVATGDRRSQAIRAEYAAVLLQSGRYREAAQEYRTLLASDPRQADYRLALARALALLLQTSPSFSLRGGTREILRGIIARGLGLR